jgi:hypothetical protein
MAVGLSIAATAVGLVLEALFNRTVADDISSTGFVIGLAALPGVSRWYVLRSRSADPNHPGGDAAAGLSRPS